jgi:pyruvate dehydrogenase E1 component
MAQDGLAAFEPAYVDELAVILGWAFDYMQRDGTARGDSVWLREAQGGSVYLRLTTRPILQPDRTPDAALRDGIIQGGYWLREPAPGAELAIAYSGAVAPEALAAWEQAVEDVPGAGLLAVTSADRLNAGWTAADRGRQTERTSGPSWIETLLQPLAPDAAIVTVHDAHPAALGWIGSVRGHRTHSLGVEHFGQTGTLDELYRAYRIDAEAILDAAAQALVARARG